MPFCSQGLVRKYITATREASTHLKHPAKKRSIESFTSKGSQNIEESEEGTGKLSRHQKNRVV
jgi:hypothetical protein